LWADWGKAKQTLKGRIWPLLWGAGRAASQGMEGQAIISKKLPKGNKNYFLKPLYKWGGRCRFLPLKEGGGELDL